MAKDTLYYDGACPICRAEVDKLTRFTGDHLTARNIHAMAADEVAPDRAQLLARLHLRTADGEWLTGLDANIRAWRHTPFRWLWEIFRFPVMRQIGEWCYEFWLRRRSAARRGKAHCE